MFEHIHFQHIDFNIPATKKTAERQLEKYGILENSLRMSDFYREHADEVDFSLDGTSRTLFPAPLSTASKDILLSVQVFGLLNAGPHYFIKRKNYHSYLLLYTYGGKGRLKYEGKEYQLEKNYGFLIDCRKEHVYATLGENWELSMLHFNGPSAALFFQQFYQNDSPVFYTDHTSTYQQNIEQLLRSCQDVSRLQEFNTAILLEKLLLEIIQEKYRDEQTLPEYIVYLKKYIENHFNNPLSLDALASFANVSKYHMEREFKKYTGFSVNEYIIALRLEQAKFLMSTLPLPLEQICLMCGFSNYSNFYKLFQKNTGLSPKQYRELSHSPR